MQKRSRGSLIPLDKNERIITAFAEHCSGPGWVNQVIWVVIQSNVGKMRIVSLQPHEQSDELRLLFDFSDMVNRKMVEEVNYLNLEDR